jgi:hypothetical protein
MYGNTAHAQQGMSCTDCHLTVTGATMGDGHGKRNHSLAVDLTTCNECHGEEMHIPLSAEQVAGGETLYSAYEPAQAAACDVDSSAVASEPPQRPARPLNYLVIAAVGMGFGVALTPWAEGAIRRFRGKHEG